MLSNNLDVSVLRWCPNSLFFCYCSNLNINQVMEIHIKMADIRASQKCHFESFLSLWFSSVPFSDKFGLFFLSIEMESDRFIGKTQIPKPLPSLYCTGSGSNWHHQGQTALLIFGIFCLHFWSMEGGGEQHPSLFYVNWNNWKMLLVRFQKKNKNTVTQSEIIGYIQKTAHETYLCS